MEWPITWIHHGRSERKVPFLPHFDLTSRQRARAVTSGCCIVLTNWREEGEAIRRIRPNYEDEICGRHRTVANLVAGGPTSP